MRLHRDEVYRLIAVAKGDIPASFDEQKTARQLYSELVDQLTGQLQEQAPGDLSITHESVRDTVEQQYRMYRRSRKGRRK